MSTQSPVQQVDMHTVDEEEVADEVLGRWTREVLNYSVDILGGGHENVDCLEAWRLAVVGYRFDHWERR